MFIKSAKATFKKHIRRFHESIFGFDNYPSLWFTSRNLKKPYKLAVPRETTKPSWISTHLNKTRIRFWTYIAKKNNNFNNIYMSSTTNFKSDKCLDHLISDGTVKIDNFLKDDDLHIFNAYIDKQRTLFYDKFNSLKSDDNYFWFNEYASLPVELYNLMSQKISTLVFPFFGKTINNPTINVNFQKSESHSFREDCTSYWHADRFIPCLAAQYYPFGADWMPTQRVKMSPKITNIEHAFMLQYHYLDIKDFPLYDDNNIISQICQPNTLYLSWHHIPHRRAITNRPGERFTIFFDFYNSFTRKDLIKNALSIRH